MLEKTAIRFQGFSFNTTLSGLIESGTHQAFTASADANGCFSIPIKYAQLAVVEFQDPLPYVSVE